MSNHADKNSIVVTGLGVVTPLGSDIETFWENLCAGVFGYEELPELAAAMPFTVGGKVGKLPAVASSDTNDHDRAVALALGAADQAVRQAGLDDDGASYGTVGVVMGSTCGTNSQLESAGFEDAWFAGERASCHEQVFTRYDHSAIAYAVSKHYGFTGPSYVVGTACASGNHAIGEAVNLLRDGQADIVVCGGADAFTTLPAFGFFAMKSLSTDQCRPFDRDRTGMILGEGAAALILETAASARARGITPLAEIRGWSLNCDARNFAAPLETGERCEELITQCLRAAGIDKSEVGYVNAHGTGTTTNDLMEARGLSRVYGVPPQPRVPVSSIKGLLGHTLGAAGAIEGVVSILALLHDRIPPNTPVTGLDEDVDIELVTRSVDSPLRHVLSLSFAFGGCNVATLFSKPIRISAHVAES